MRNKTIHNMAVLIILSVLVMAVAIITYMGVQTYRSGRDSAMLNCAVRTSSNIAELAAGAGSKADFIDSVSKNIGKVSSTVGGYDLKGKNDTIIKIRIRMSDSGSGSIMHVRIITYSGDRTVYSLSTEKYLSDRKAGDAA